MHILELYVLYIPFFFFFFFFCKLICYTQESAIVVIDHSITSDQNYWKKKYNWLICQSLIIIEI